MAQLLVRAARALLVRSHKNFSLFLAFRIGQLVVGLFLYGAATAIMVRAVVGVSSWSVLTQGLEHVVPWSFGTITLVVSAAVLIFWIPLKQRPRVGTLLNALTIGPATDLVLGIVQTPAGFASRILLFSAGIVMLALATACYIGAQFGTGARDGLMLGLHERLGWPVWIARTVVEGTVLVAGWFLGGNVGVGTVVAAFAIGPLVGILLPIFNRMPWTPRVP